MKRHLAKPAAALGILAMLLPGAALALTYSPPSYDFVADPGNVVNDTLHVRNDTPAALHIEVSALNFAGKAGDETSGIPDFYPAGEVRDGKGMGAWISFAKNTVDLKPGEQGEVSFKISVPKDALPGSHFGAIEMTTKTPGAQGGIGLISNSVSLVLLKVTGDATEDLKLTSFTASPTMADSLPVRFEARLQNDGKVHERPYGQVVVKNVFGRTVKTIPMNRADNVSVLPGAARRIEASWSRRILPKNASILSRQWNNFALGPYKVELTLNYDKLDGTKELLTASTTVWIFPWLALLLIVVGVAVVIVGLKKLLAWHDRRIIKKYKEKI